MSEYITINRFNIDLSERGIKQNFVIVVPFGDFHYGSDCFNKEHFNKVYNWIIRTKNVFVIGMGDYMEMANEKYGTSRQIKTAEKQKEFVVKVFKPLADEDRLIGLHYGNHSYRQEMKNFGNPIKEICEMSKSFSNKQWNYLDEGAINHIFLTKEEMNQKYIIYTTHGGTGASSSAGRVNSVKRLRAVTNAECYCMGHTHDLQTVSQDFIDSETGENRVIFFILTGSYLLFPHSYAHRKGLEPARQGSPKIKLHLKTHRISVSEA